MTIQARTERGSVDQLTLRLTPDDGQTRYYPMQRTDDGSFAFTLDSVERSFDYRIEGGGTWTVPNRVTVLARPIIQTLAAEVHLPAYMKRPEPRLVDAQASQISAPIGSTIHLRTEVRGSATEGRIDIYHASIKQKQIDELHESVWIDDALPPDAERIGKWHWVREPAYSGTRAHTFDWSHKPYGFRTHLNPLKLDKGESMFVYVRLDPDDPPTQILLTAKGKKETHRLLWGAEPTKEQKKQGFQRINPLPKPGQWARLQLKPDRPVTLNELTFQMDDGKAVFDRVGALRPVHRTVETTVLKKVASHPLHQDPATGDWLGDIPVKEDSRFTLAFRNALDHESAAMQPMPIIATQDEAPTLVVERPGQSITLDNTDPLPLVVRAFDDYGVADVALQIGADPDKLGEPETVQQFDKPHTSRVVMASLDPEALHMKPGETMHYRVLVRDRKGQTAYSEPFRLALATPQQMRTAKAEQDKPGAGQDAPRFGQAGANPGQNCGRRGRPARQTAKSAHAQTRRCRQRHPHQCPGRSVKPRRSTKAFGAVAIHAQRRSTRAGSRPPSNSPSSVRR